MRGVAGAGPTKHGWHSATAAARIEDAKMIARALNPAFDQSLDAAVSRMLSPIR
jgi:hypothetical protein